jgi:hypothetical protein
MSLAPRSASFFRRLVARRLRREQDDPADMGTAFGLEASLGPVSEPRLASASDRRDVPAEAPDASPMAWLARLHSRRR